MKPQELREIGIPPGGTLRTAAETLGALSKDGLTRDEMRAKLEAVVARPENFTDDPALGRLAAELIEAGTPFVPRAEPAPYESWGEDLDEGSVDQMKNACQLPVAVRGALMPDAHLGYGLPIGGVLATENCVIPYAVGVDIACRMKLTVLDLPVGELNHSRGKQRLSEALERETRFGIGASFQEKRRHDVLDKDWSVSPVTKNLRDKAWSQLGTSGSGNHFVEFGILAILPEAGLDLPAGHYLALLSHSGSRGTGAAVCGHYSKIAQQKHADLPKDLMHLAWLDLDSADGAEYWAAMNLMGDYAAANHACIHAHIAKNLGVEVLLDVENHHNFAWKEMHEGREVIVHRKGATPAGEGVLGVIPGSMASPGFVVRGKGRPESLHSASHGAGRVMSRRQAGKTFDWNTVNPQLEAAGVTLLSAGIDEVPGVYKDIHQVMQAQQDLVDPLAEFTPRLVKMAPAGERPED